MYGDTKPIGTNSLAIDFNTDLFIEISSCFSSLIVNISGFDRNMFSSQEFRQSLGLLVEVDLVLVHV